MYSVGRSARRALLSVLIGSTTLAAGVWMFQSRGQDDQRGLSEPKTKELPRIERNIARAEYTFRLLRDPATNRIPPNIRERELAHARALRAAQGPILGTAAATALNWQEAGPDDVGGRTRALAVDRNNSNTILAGSASGGVWKSVDGGASWALKTTTNQAVTGLAQAGTSNTWYYCTGELLGSASDLGQFASYYGSGIYKSTNGGETWSQIQSAGNSTSFDTFFDFVSKIRVHPTTGSVFIASNAVGISRSDDGGATFNLVLGKVNAHVWSDFDIAADGTIVAVLSQAGLGVQGQPGVFKSTNNGANWTTITPNTFPATHGRSVVAIAPSNTNAAYVLTEVSSDDLRLHKINLQTGSAQNLSANLPNFGEPVGQPNTQGGYNLLINVKPDNENFVVFGWTNLHRSTDGVTTPMNNASKHWIGGYATVNNISQYANHHPDNHIVVFDPSNPNRMWSGHDGGVSMVPDIRTEPVVWQDMNHGYNVTQFYTVSQHPASGDKRMAGGTQDNGSPYFLRGEPGSDDISSGDGATVYFGNTVVLSSAQQGQIVHFTYDNQDNLQYTGTIQRPEGGSYLFIHPFAVDPADETKVYFPTADHFFRHTGNGNWQELSNVSAGGGVTITAVEVSKSSHRLYYAGFSQGAPTVFRLDNANTATDGEVSIPIPGVPASSYPHSIAIHPTNPDEAIVVFSNYNIVGLYHTTNAGASWTAIEGNLTGTTEAPGPSLRDALIYVEGGQPRYLVATSTGVYSASTLNGGSTAWSLEDPNGMGNVVVDALDLRVSDNQIAAGTHGRGAFTASSTSQPTISDGDINNDSSVNVLDVVLGVNNIVDPVGHPLTGDQSERGDVFPVGGGDDVLNTQDITRIVNFILKLDTPSAPVEGLGPVLVTVGNPVADGLGIAIPVTIRGEAVAGGQFALTVPGVDWVEAGVRAEGASIGLAAHATGDQIRVLFYDLTNAIPTEGLTLMLPYHAGGAAGEPRVSGLLVADPRGFARETTVGTGAGTGDTVRLLRASPNPMTSETVISFRLETDAVVRLAVYDVQGRPVRELTSGVRPAGAHEIPWDGRDDAGATLPAGMYFYRLTTPDSAITQKLLIQG